MQKTLSQVNLNAIAGNADRVLQIIGKRFFYAVVKADAYGHGAVEVSKAIEHIVDGFCVAIADEGAELRIGGIDKPILVFAPPLDGDDAQKLAFYNLQATIVDKKSAELANGLPCHIAVNTGMNRYGCNLADLPALLKSVNANSIVGVYSHLYAPNNAKISATQLTLFKDAERIVKAYSPHAIAHLAASGGILSGKKFLCDGVRCGLLLYGYAPSGFSGQGFTPALKVYAHLAQTTKPTGGGVGYNVADREYTRLYTYRLGYADGFFRGVPLGEKTLCMDAFISETGGELLPVLTNADEYADRANTISYEVLCSVTARSLRLYER